MKDIPPPFLAIIFFLDKLQKVLYSHDLRIKPFQLAIRVINFRNKEVLRILRPVRNAKHCFSKTFCDTGIQMMLLCAFSRRKVNNFF